MIGPTTYAAVRETLDRGGEKVPPACMDCKYFRETQVFLLCTHADAAYKVAEKVDQHTIGHMRSVYLCGEDGKLFEPGPIEILSTPKGGSAFFDAFKA